MSLLAAGRLLNSDDMVDLTPQDAGWKYTGLRVLRLRPGAQRVISTFDSEVFVLPLAGSVTVEVAAGSNHDSAGGDHDSAIGEHDSAGGPDAWEATFELRGRQSVFTQVTDFAYAGRDSVIRLTSASGAEVAVPSARCTARLKPRYGPAAAVPVEVRGAGPSTRQVTNFGVPGVWDHAEKLICCELITPGGNWSSYPPHKHDASDPCTVLNEEIYYYRIAGQDQVTPSRTGFGLHRTYTGPEHELAGLSRLDELIEVRDGDAVLIPHGYHGPCVAAPGYPMYYLNVLAGPGDKRSMAFCDDPAHEWVRGSWDTLPADPRCPVTSSTGLVRS